LAFGCWLNEVVLCSLFVVICFLLRDFIFMVVISTECNGGCQGDWFFDDYWVLQPEWNEEISRELGVGGWWLGVSGQQAVGLWLWLLAN
jgi:hypothetical protein